MNGLGPVIFSLCPSSFFDALGSVVALQPFLGAQLADLPPLLNVRPKFEQKRCSVAHRSCANVGFEGPVAPAASAASLLFHSCKQWRRMESYPSITQSGRFAGALNVGKKKTIRLNIALSTGH